MPAAMGERTCPKLGCGRRIYVSPGGTVYARCLDHTLALLRGAIRHPAIQQGARVSVASPRLLGPGSLLGVELASTAATRGG